MKMINPDKVNYIPKKKTQITYGRSARVSPIRETEESPLASYQPFKHENEKIIAPIDTSGGIHFSRLGNKFDTPKIVIKAKSPSPFGIKSTVL